MTCTLYMSSRAEHPPPSYYYIYFLSYIARSLLEGRLLQKDVYVCLKQKSRKKFKEKDGLLYPPIQLRPTGSPRQQSLAPIHDRRHRDSVSELFPCCGLADGEDEV